MGERKMKIGYGKDEYHPVLAVYRLLQPLFDHLGINDDDPAKDAIFCLADHLEIDELTEILTEYGY